MAEDEYRQSVQLAQMSKQELHMGKIEQYPNRWGACGEANEDSIENWPGEGIAV